jgi:hypothetical protein
MFKLDKNTHMMILFTFALVFVVIYLYYTITDVRKMQRDIARLSSEVSALANKQPTAPQVAPAPPTAPVSPVVEIKECKPIVESKVATASSTEEDVLSESSVTTEDIKATLDSVDAEDADADEDEPVIVAQEDIQPTPSEVDVSGELGKMKFEDIKELCRSKGIKIQGSKDVLIKRLIEHGL